MSLLSYFRPDHRNSQNLQLFSDGDDFGIYANTLLGILDSSSQAYWSELVNYARGLTASKPPKKHLLEMTKMVGKIGTGAYTSIVKAWIDHIEKMKPWQKNESPYSGLELICEENRTVLRSIFWILGEMKSDEALVLLYRGSSIFYRKIPEKGPASLILGNACVSAMVEYFPARSISYLFMLRQRVRQPSIISSINKSISKIGNAMGYSHEELEDMSLQDFSIKDGIYRYENSDLEAEIDIRSFGVEYFWKYKGEVYQSLPKSIQIEFADRVKDIKQTGKELGALLTRQKARFEEFLLTGRRIPYNHFMKYFLNHPISGIFTKALLWNIYDAKGRRLDTIYFHGENGYNQKNEKFIFEEDYSLQLFHPVEENIEIEEWKSIFQEKNIIQPIKQLEREVFGKDFDLNSIMNRRILQHQAVSLAKERFWQARLQGNFDSGDMGFRRNVPEYDILVIIKTEVEHEKGLTQAGIFNEIHFEELRWERGTTRESLLIKDIPDRIFSEIIRDTLLFVSVAKGKEWTNILDFLHSLK